MFHTLSLLEVKRETPDSVSLLFNVPENLRATFAFQAGQYLTLKTSINGQEERRSYSICSAEGQNELRVAIKRVEDGVFSTFANSALKAGDYLDVMPPQGRFVLKPAQNDNIKSPRIIAAFAAGSGITPLLSIIATELSRNQNSRIFLFYGNQSTNSILFREALDDLKDHFLGRLSVFHFLSRETQDVPLLNGRLSAEKLSIIHEGILPLQSIDEAFICGPHELIDAIESGLKTAGLSAKKIHTERFTTSGTAKPTARPRIENENIAAAPIAAHVTLISDGIGTRVPMHQGETVLEAALRAGLDLPYSCRGGMCCTCRAKISAGEVDMLLNYSLEQWEMDAGFALTCQAVPKTPEITVDFDAV